MDKKFLTIGTNEIKEDCFRKVQDVVRDNGVLKPAGGMWFTQYTGNDFNTWVDRLLYDDNMRYLWFVKCKRENPFKFPCCVANLRGDSHIYILHNDQSFDYLMKCFPYDKSYFSYEEMSKYYDGIYVNLSSSLYSVYKDRIKDMSYKFVEDSLVLFNLDCISHYYSGHVSVDPFDYGSGIVRPGDYSIQLDNVKKKVLKK